MKIDQKHIIRVLIIVSIVLTILSLHYCVNLNSTQKVNQQFKQKILQKDSLTKIKQGQYTKLVNDLKTSRQLSKDLEQSNTDLSKQIRNKNQKIIQLTTVIQSFKPKTDTVVVQSKSSSFEDYYPNKNDWFIKYNSIVMSDTTRLGQWNFSKLKVDLVITQQSQGLYSAYIDGPDFLEVSKLDVRSLPLKNIDRDNFDWLVGAGPSVNMQQQSFAIQGFGGVRVKNTMILLSADTKQNIGLIWIKQL